MQSNLQLVITCSHYRYWLMMALSMWRPWRRGQSGLRD